MSCQQGNCVLWVSLGPHLEVLMAGQQGHSGQGRGPCVTLWLLLLSRVVLSCVRSMRAVVFV